MGIASKAETALSSGLEDARYAGRRTARAARLASGDVTSRVRDLLDDLDHALANAKSASDVEALRDEIGDKLRQARRDFSDARANLRRRASEVWDEADGYVHERPWQALGTVAAVALVLGFIAGRS
ncbi:DUF883 family protein [Pandoraea pulmonicola]|uniref:Bacterial protein of uncharacterized function (DUF883) n=1 Tax=Pandoraea pulmonicola TaxID=93221 RepID=A0AAJ5D173_PANPU|nr:DUF883 family protein [Pandoraea pulmonicola]SUA91432.1 Bacterial protein of uncharacterised function (DUF883) [Pandoraea pulmonicola]